MNTGLRISEVFESDMCEIASEYGATVYIVTETETYQLDDDIEDAIVQAVKSHDSLTDQITQLELDKKELLDILTTKVYKLRCGLSVRDLVYIESIYVEMEDLLTKHKRGM